MDLAELEMCDRHLEIRADVSRKKRVFQGAMSAL